MIRFACPSCGKSLQVDDRQAGLAVRCPGCAATTHVPDPGDGPEDQLEEVDAVRRDGGVDTPEAGIQSGPEPAHAGQPPDLRDEITRHPGPAVFCSQQPRNRDSPVGSKPPRSKAPKGTSSSGQLSLILGAVAIFSIGVGFFLQFAGRLSHDTVGYTLRVSLGPVCVGSVLALPGMALGLASLEQRGRANSAGVAGCWMNGLILGAWLLLFLVVPFAGANRGGYQGYSPPPYGYSPPPYDEKNLFKFRR
jgi:hypothetical protein